MITVKIFVFNPFQENTYLLHDESGECVIIDAGCYHSNEKKQLDEYIHKQNLTCKKLVNTHCHVDHILGNAYIAKTYQPEIFSHKDDSYLIDEAAEHGQIFGFNVEDPPAPTQYLADNSELHFGNSVLKVFHVPGHSPGSIALYSPDQNFIIVGDVLFKGSIGRTDLSGGDYDQLMKSIFTRLMTLPPNTVVYPGHGPATTIHEEALSNPFLA